MRLLSTTMLAGLMLALLGSLAYAEIRLGLVTNGPSDFQRDKLRTLGIEDRLDAIVISGEVAAAKPDAVLFQRALELLGAEPGEAWHVGDSLDTDVAGARAAGLVAVWLNRKRIPVDDAVRPDLEIASLGELTAQLQRGSRRTI